MKKTIMLVAVLLTGIAASRAQNASSAVMLSERTYEGTARSVAMGNAFTGLGGELGALNLNPAAGGMYRYMEITFTQGIGGAYSSADYLGTVCRDSRTKYSIPNAAFIIPFSTGRRHGLMNFNIGLSVNRTADYNRNFFASGSTSSSSFLAGHAAAMNGIPHNDLDIVENGYNAFYDSFYSWKDILLWNSSLVNGTSRPGEYIGATQNADGSIGGMLVQKYRYMTSGSKNQTDINFSGNFNDRFFFGMNLGIVSIDYSFYESFYEEAADPAAFATGFNRFEYQNSVSTRGTGINLNFGFIYRIAKGLSVGGQISTPTWFNLTDIYESSISSRLNATETDPKPYRADIKSPLGRFDYAMTSPFRWSVGASYVLGNRLALSVDYENCSYSQTRLNDTADPATFAAENEHIRNSYAFTSNVRAGIEFRATDILSLRAGYNYYGHIDAAKTYDPTHIAAAGIGLNFKNGFFMDLAYQHNFSRSEEFSLYPSAPGMPAPYGTASNWKYKVFLTLGFRI